MAIFIILYKILLPFIKYLICGNKNKNIKKMGKRKNKNKDTDPILLKRKKIIPK